MTIRTRSILIDNTTTTVYTGIATVGSANASSYLLRNVPRQLPIIMKEAGVSVQTVTATKGWKVYSNTIISQIDMECMKSNSSVSNTSVAPVNVIPLGNALVISVRSVDDNTGITTTYGSAAITSNNILSSTPVNYNINANQTVYVDIIQTGSYFPGSGLKTTLYYYGG